MRIHFIVRFDIVYGLKFVNNVYKLFARVDQEEEKMGSFAPQPTPHVFDLAWIEAPKGLLVRGDYKGKGLVNYLLYSSLMEMALSIANLITFAKFLVIGEVSSIDHKLT